MKHVTEREVAAVEEALTLAEWRKANAYDPETRQYEVRVEQPVWDWYFGIRREAPTTD